MRWRQDLVQYLCLDDDLECNSEETQLKYLFQAMDEDSSSDDDASSGSSSSSGKKKRTPCRIVIGYENIYIYIYDYLSGYDLATFFLRPSRIRRRKRKARKARKARRTRQRRRTNPRRRKAVVVMSAPVTGMNRLKVKMRRKMRRKMVRRTRTKERRIRRKLKKRKRKRLKNKKL